MPAVLSKPLKSPICAEMYQNYQCRGGKGLVGMNSNDLRKLKTYFQVTMADTRNVKKGAVRADDLSLETRSFLHLRDQLKRYEDAA